MWGRIDAIVGLIATLRASNPVEALVQVALAGGIIDRIASAKDDDDDEADELLQAGRLLDSAVRALLRHTAIEPREYAIDPYTSTAVNDSEWPGGL